MGGFAWVTLATNDSYSLGALVLAHSLKQVGTTKQLAVLITPGVTSAMREKLASVFNVVQEVNILDSKDESNLRLLKRPELGVTFTKLHCWRLTQFDKCVFLDADTLVLQNCDELFDREELSAAPDVGWPDCFNSGVFVYRPSNETYDKLVSFALEKGSFDGGDQGLLNLYFSDWSTKDINKHLPFIYNLCSTACYSYLPAFKQFGALAKIIHFIGTSKPWLQYFDTETRKVQPSGDLKHLERVLQHWWDIFCNLIHHNLTPDMARSSSDVTHTSISSHIPQNHEPQPHRTKNLIWDPWEEYDQKQSSFSSHEIHEPSQEKPIESHNTNAYNVASHQNVPTQFQYIPPPVHHIPPSIQHDPPPFQHDPPPFQHNPPPFQHNPPPFHQDPPQFQHPVPTFQHHVSTFQHNVPTFQHNVPTFQHVPPPFEHITPPNRPKSPPRQENNPHIVSSTVNEQFNSVPPPKTDLGRVEEQIVTPPQVDVHYIPHQSSNSINSSHNSVVQPDVFTEFAPKPIEPLPSVPPSECEAAATVCKETTLHTPLCEDEADSGLAGAFAQLTLGTPRTEEQKALDDHLRRQGWEVGNIDYLGRDSFDNIWNKICETLSAAPPPPAPAPKAKEPSPPPTEAKPTETTVIEASVELPKQEIPPSAPVIAPQETIKDSSVASTETAIPQAPQSTILEQPKEVPPTETSKETPSESIECSLPLKETQSETVQKPQETPADTTKEVSAVETSSLKEVAQPEAGDQIPQTTPAPSAPAPTPFQETPASPQETPAPPQETPAPPQETTSAPPQETPAPPQETPAQPQETPAQPQETPAPPPVSSAPPQEAPVPSQPASAPPQETPAPPTKQEIAVPSQVPTPVEEAPQQISAPAPASPLAQEKPSIPAEITPTLPQATKDVPPLSTPDACSLPSLPLPAEAQPPTVPTPEAPTTIASTALPQEAAPPVTPSEETVTSPPEAPLQKVPESVPAPSKEAIVQPVKSTPQQSPKAAPQEAPKSPEVKSTPQPAAPPEAPQGTAAATTPPVTPPAETPKGKSKAKEGTEQQKQSTAQGAPGATAASPTPPPRKGPTGGKKTKSKK